MPGMGFMLNYRDLNIIHVAPPLGGGVASVVEQLAREQVRLGARVTVVHPIAPDARFNSDGLTVEKCPARRVPGGTMLLGVPYWKVVADRGEGHPTLVHYHGLAAQGCIGWSRHAGVCTLHGVSALANLSAPRKLLVRAAFRRGTKFVAVDPATAEYFSAFCPSEIAVIPNGIASLPEECRSATSNAAPVILFVGNLDELKGYRYALEAARELASRGVDFKMRFAGLVMREDLAYFKRFCGDNGLEGRVEYLGVVKDAGAALVPKCDVVLLPSRTEGFPMFLLEALRAGKPMLATHVGGIPCLLKDGENGFFVERDGRDIADKAERLLGDPVLLSSFSRRSEELFDAEYRIEGVCERYLGEYARALESFRGAR